VRGLVARSRVLLILRRKQVVRRQAGEVHETFQPAAARSGADPVAAREMDQGKARRREIAERRTGSFAPIDEQMREFGKSWIVPNDHHGFYGWGKAFKKTSQGIDIRVVEPIIDFAGWFLRKFPQHDIERFASPAGGRNEGELGDKTGCMTISAHACRISAPSRRQWSCEIALGCVGHGFSMANEEEPWHRARE